MDLKRAVELAREAAEIADGIMMKYYKTNYKTYKKEGARGKAEAILTEPDLLCDEALTDFFSEKFPETVIVSEESFDRIEDGWHEEEWIWYIDPIDGSLSYVEGSDSFGVSIALVHRGVPVLGVITNPVLKLSAWAAEGHGAFINGNAVSFADTVSNPPRLVLSIGQNNSKSYQFAMKFLQPGETDFYRSVVTKALMILQRQGDYYFSLPYEVFHGGQPNYWDFAGSAAILNIAGGHSTDIYGDPMVFNGPSVKWKKGHIFAHPEALQSIHAPLLQAVEERKKMEF